MATVLLPAKADGTPLDPSSTPANGSAESIVESLMPFFSEENKTRYLGYRASGFTVRESTRLCGIHERTVRRWREADMEFVHWESNITDLRQQLGAKFAFAEFLKNFRLVMAKDQQVLNKAVLGETLTKADEDYLKTIRPNYTPQQLLAVQNALMGKSDDTKFNFTQLVLNMARGDLVVEAPR